MEKAIKRIIIAVLLLCVALAFVCFAACGKNTPDDSSNENRHENSQNDQNQNFLDNDNVPDIILSADGKSVIGLKNHNLRNLVISSSYNGITVTAIGDSAFESCDSLVSVTLPDTITSIGSYAFRSCDSLTSIIIPDNVTRIGVGAFKSCDSLVSVTVGSGVISIENGYPDYPFQYCYKLVEVINNSSLTITKGSSDNGYIGKYALNVKTEGTSDIVNKDDYLFYTYDNVNYLLGYVGNETSLTLPDNYNGQSYEIYERAFYNCDSIVSITIPDTITSISDYAFEGCNSLVSVTIGNNVKSIGKDAFRGCSLLVEVINKSNLNIKKGGEANGYLGYYALYVYNDDTSKVVKQGDYLFITDESGVNYLLRYLGNARDLTLPNNYNGQSYEIYESAFFACYSLVRVTIPDGVTSIGKYAFQACHSLTFVNIGNSVTSIGRYAFYYCHSLLSVKIGSGLVSMPSDKDGNIFSDSSVIEIVNNSYLNLQGYSNTKFVYSGESKIVNKGGYLFISDDDANYLIGYRGTDTKLTLPKNYNGENYEIYYSAFSESYTHYNVTSVTIPDSVTSIGDYAFDDCHSLKRITIPNSVTSIGVAAFRDCTSLTSITIPDSVTSIGDSVFSGCSNLTNITIPNSVTFIGDSVFSDCTSLTSITIPNSVTSIGSSVFSGCSSLTNITIPNSVTSIGGYAFDGCSSLTSITIPDSVTSIFEGAFSGCSSLTSVTFENPNGWYVGKRSTATRGIRLTLTNTSTNATYLTSTYDDYYWYKV